MMRQAVHALAKRTGGAMLVCTVATATLAACGGGGPTRSVGAFCSTLESEKQQYLHDYNTKGQDPLSGLVTGMSAMGEIPVIFDKLDKVAPPEIEPDVAATRDAFQHQIDGIGDMASNPLGALAGGIVSGLVANGPFTRVSNYIAKNCPGEGGASSSGATGVASAPTSTTLATAPKSAGWGSIVAGDTCDVVGGHVVLTPSSGLTFQRNGQPVVGGPGGTALVRPTAPKDGANASLVSWDANGNATNSLAASAVASSASGTTELASSGPLVGTDADGIPWAIYAATTTVAGTGLQADQVSHPISAFRLDREGRAWQVDGLLGAAQPVDPNVSVPVFRPAIITGHVVIGQMYPVIESTELVALKLSDGTVAWRRPLGTLNWQGADGALFVDTSDSQSGDQPKTEIDDPDTGIPGGTFAFDRYDASIVGLPDKDRWILSQSGSGKFVIVDGRGTVVGQRETVESTPSVDPESGIMVVQFQDGHFEGIDTSTGTTAWSIDAGLARNTDFEVQSVGNGFVSAKTKSGAVALDIHTGKQVWTGALTAAAPLGEVVNGRLLTCQGTVDTSSTAGSAALSIPVTATPLGLDHDTPIYP